MLITQLKSKETIDALAKGKIVIINCHGCKEVYFPEEEAKELQKELSAAGNVYADCYNRLHLQPGPFDLAA